MSWYNDVKAVFDRYSVPEYIWVPILYAESAGNPNAVNDTRGKSVQSGASQEFSIGLFQINLLARGIAADKLDAEAARLRSPAANAEAAAPAIAAAWKVVKETLASQPKEIHSPQVAIRSGHPGGGPSKPCTENPVCVAGYQNVLDKAKKYISGVLPAIGGVAPVAGGLPSPTPGPTPVVGPAPPVFTVPKIGLPQLPNIENPLANVDWKDAGIRAAVFVVGAAVFFIAIAAILYEQVPPEAKTAARKAVQVAAVGPAGAAV